LPDLHRQTIARTLPLDRIIEVFDLMPADERIRSVIFFQEPLERRPWR